MATASRRELDRCARRLGRSREVEQTYGDVLPDEYSRRTFVSAGEPKQLRLYEGAGLGLDSLRDEIFNLLVQCIPEHLVRARF